ncbi:MAG: ABC transporter permease [Candidatus Eisenbacteria bacterium]|nr:ABC transporter permease [Candidatus Eisenbacteria bacterium]
MRPHLRHSHGLSRARDEAAAVGRALAAFLCRSVATRLSYRVQLVLGLARSVLSIALIALVGKVVACAGGGFEARYGMGYTEFALLGLAAHGAAAAGLGAFRSAVRREQLQGTLEQLLAAHGPPTRLVLLSGVWDVLGACVGGAAFVALASWRGGLRMEMSAAVGAAAGLYVIAMCGLGLASAGVVLVTKEGEPVSWALGMLSLVAGGVYYPVDLLPSWAQPVSLALPTTHVLAVMRGTASTGASTTRASLAFLGVAAAAACILGAAALRWGIGRARGLGTLGEY